MGLYLGIFLVTLSGLMFEVGLTRIFSATIWYHFAFVAISVALLGWGLGGFALHLARGRIAFNRDRVALLTLLYGLSIPLALWLIVRVPFHPDRLVFYFAVSLLPFLLAGMALSMLFAIERQRHGPALLRRPRRRVARGARRDVPPLLARRARPPSSPWRSSRSRRPVPSRGSGAPRPRRRSSRSSPRSPSTRRPASSSSAARPRRGSTATSPHTPGAKIVLTGWNAYSRIDAVTGFAPPTLARLYIDSDAWTNVNSWDGRIESAASMREWDRAVSFKVAPPSPKTLVIGPGGGSDVLVALGAGSEKVTAVEMNPLMLRFARSFGALAGNLYDNPRVEVVLSEGRTFIRRSDRQFDVDPDGLRRLVGGGRVGGALALREPPLHGRGVPRLLRPPHAGRADRDPALDGGHPPARLERGRDARARGGRPARGGAPAEERRRPRGAAADDVHPEEAAVHRGREGHARLARDHAAGGRARPPRRRAVRVPLLGKEDLRAVRRGGDERGSTPSTTTGRSSSRARSRGACPTT